MIQNHTPNQQAGECHVCGITSLKGYQLLPTHIKISFTQKILARMLGQSGTVSSDFTTQELHRNIKDADTTATTIETVFNDNDADNGCDWQY